MLCRGRWLIGRLWLRVGLATCVLAIPLEAQVIPLPHASAPLRSTAASHAFGGAAFTMQPTDLSQDGYVEEEILVSGRANVYDWPPEGPAQVRSSDVPYTTRVLVRRPRQRSRFSGTVVVENLNPSNLFDLNIGWAISHRQMQRNGDAWVGITAKPVAIEALRTFDPERYAALSWPNPLPVDDPRNCTELRPDTKQETENGLVWDIYRQVATWLRAPVPSNPLSYGARTEGEHPVRYLLAWGYSQTGSFLQTYINAFHELDVQARGKPLFDGYLVAVAFGPSPVHQCAGRLSPDDPRRTMRPIGVPVVRVMTQSDYLRTLDQRLEDSDSPPRLFRNYEVAGSAHATPDELLFAAAPQDIEKAGRDVPPMACNEGRRSRFPNAIAFNAILENLERWVRDGTPPPRAEPIQIVDGQPVLDEHGNVRGGVRSPYVDVPTSTWIGNSTGASFCFLAGHEVPFGKEKLRALYPDHASYVAAVEQSVRRLVAERFVTEEDGRWLIEQAQSAEVP